MGYSANTKINPTIAERERQMLATGLSYAEIAQITGARQKSISERNRLVHRIDIQRAFAERIERDGVPSRLNISDPFGYWFSGIFDGEGHLGAWRRDRPDGYAERRLFIQIRLRDDDIDVLRRIQNEIGAGVLVHYPGKGNANPSAMIRIEQIKDLAELIIPLFDKYPLYTKKRDEYAIWRTLVRSQYVATLGGYSQRVAGSQEHTAAFDAGVNAIAQIRTYVSREHSA